MRDPSPYAGRTVTIRADAAELGGHPAEVVDWFERTGQRVGWKIGRDRGDPRATGYAVRRGLGGLPDNDEVLYARVDGMGALIHVSEIDGAQLPVLAALKAGPAEVSPWEIGTPCVACKELLADGDFVAILPLGPGRNPAARLNARSGFPYDALTIELHWACRTGDETYEIPEA